MQTISVAVFSRRRKANDDLKTYNSNLKVRNGFIMNMLTHQMVLG